MSFGIQSRMKSHGTVKISQQFSRVFIYLYDFVCLIFIEFFGITSPYLACTLSDLFRLIAHPQQ